jgi:hypothetical protein
VRARTAWKIVARALWLDGLATLLPAGIKVETMSPETRQSRTYRCYRIVVLQLGETWDAIVYAPPNWSIVADIEGASAQEAMVKAMRVVDATQQ